MASATAISQSVVSRIWRLLEVKPHATEPWKLSTDPQLVEKVRDVVGIHQDPPEDALVLAVDERRARCRPSIGRGRSCR
jgi:hypothetical protein